MLLVCPPKLEMMLGGLEMKPDYGGSVPPAESISDRRTGIL